MQFLANNRRVTICRRAVIEDSDSGETRGDFADVYRCHASIRPQLGSKVVESGLVQNGISMVLQVRDCADARLITIADRLRFSGEPEDQPAKWSIEAVGQPVRSGGYIELIVLQKIGG
jgi:head-tail adaptor